MYIKAHGGSCCGIKHIHGMIAPWQAQGSFKDQTGTASNYYEGSAPKETALNRFDRYLNWLKRHPGHCVEVVLASERQYGDASCTSASITTMIKNWEPLLLERGFLLVNKFTNSNSRNEVRVYHQLIVEGKVTLPKKPVSVASAASSPPS